MLRFCNRKCTFTMQLCKVCWLRSEIWLMPEFTDMANHWMNSLSRLLKHKVAKKKTAPLYSGSSDTGIRWRTLCPLCFCVHTSLDHDPNPTNNESWYIYFPKKIQKLLLFIGPICKLLCSDWPSQQHFNNLNTISIIHFSIWNKKHCWLIYWLRWWFLTEVEDQGKMWWEMSRGAYYACSKRIKVRIYWGSSIT